MLGSLPIDLGLAQVTAAAAGAASPAEAISSATALVRERRQALDAAQGPLRQLANTLSHIARVLPYTKEGWPQQRAELEALIDADPLAGLAAWLDYWFGAAGRTGAQARLEQVTLPPSAELARERAVTAARGLAAKEPRPAAALLALGSRGFEVGGRRIPDADTGNTLSMLSARLHLHAAAGLKNGGAAEAEVAALLDAAGAMLRAGGERNEKDAGRLALRARLERLRGNAEEAAALYQQAHDIDPRDLDVTCEMIFRSQSGSPSEDDAEAEVLLSSAAASVDALQSLADLDGDLGRLVDVPAELWIAVAGRAQRERNLDAARAALASARSAAEAAGSQETAATAAGMQAELALTAADRLRAYLDAGDGWIIVQQVERARLAYDAARSLDVGQTGQPQLQASATVRWADAVTALAGPEPYLAKAGKLKAALADLTVALPQADVAGEDSWGYLVEAEIRRQLAEAVTEPRERHVWLALLATARSAALLPTEPTRWSKLSETTSLLNLGEGSVAAGRRAVELQRDVRAVSNLTRALVNTGQLDEASALLDELASGSDGHVDASDADWIECVRGYLALLQGDAPGATRIFAATTVPPLSPWAWTSFATAVSVTEDVTKGAALSASFLEGMGNREPEMDWLFGAAFDAMLHGDVVAALGHARRMTEAALPGEVLPPMMLGMALLLSGDADVGRDRIAEAVGGNLVAMLEWERLWGPLIQRVAGQYDLAPVDLAALRPVIASARAKLPAAGDPVAELRRLPPRALSSGALSSGGFGPGEEECQSMAVALVIALAGLTRAAEADPADVIAAVAAFPALAAEAASLRAHADRIRSARSADSDPQPGRAEAGGAEAGGAGAGGAGAGGAELVFRLELPVPWFEGLADPLREHDLFVRYIPELRARVDWTVPPLVVTDNAGLGTGGFRIVVNDEIRDWGVVDPASRYCPQAGLGLLPPAVASHPGRVLTDYGWSIPAAAFGDADGLARLLTLSAAEVVVRAVGEVARTLPAAEG